MIYICKIVLSNLPQSFFLFGSVVSDTPYCIMCKHFSLIAKYITFMYFFLIVGFIYSVYFDFMGEKRAKHFVLS